jgi:hypothetical protein
MSYEVWGEPDDGPELPEGWLSEEDAQELRDRITALEAQLAARATAEQSAPYGVVYEWDCGPGVVHRDFGFCTYNGRYPDRTVTVYAAPVEANTLKVKK